MRIYWIAKWFAAALAVTLLVPSALAQRAVQSPLVVTVSRDKTASGRNTEYDTGYSSSKTYNRAVALKINVRNMSTNKVDVRMQALFVAEAMSSGAADGIYCKREEKQALASREAFDFMAESDPLGSSVYKSYYGYNYKSGSKFKGYIVRIFANENLVDVTGSTPSLQKLGWDEKAIKKMMPVEEENEMPRRRVPSVRAEEPAQPAQPAQPSQPARKVTTF